MQIANIKSVKPSRWVIPLSRRQMNKNSNKNTNTVTVSANIILLYIAVQSGRVKSLRRGKMNKKAKKQQQQTNKQKKQTKTLTVNALSVLR